jgi:hypothetical protein
MSRIHWVIGLSALWGGDFSLALGEGGATFKGADLGLGLRFFNTGPHAFDAVRGTVRHRLQFDGDAHLGVVLLRTQLLGGFWKTPDRETSLSKLDAFSLVSGLSLHFTTLRFVVPWGFQRTIGWDSSTANLIKSYKELTGLEIMGFSEIGSWKVGAQFVGPLFDTSGSENLDSHKVTHTYGRYESYFVQGQILLLSTLLLAGKWKYTKFNGSKIDYGLGSVSIKPKPIEFWEASAGFLLCEGGWLVEGGIQSPLRQAQDSKVLYQTGTHTTEGLVRSLFMGLRRGML